MHMMPTLTEANALIQATFNIIPSPILVVDEDVRIQTFNTAAACLLDASNERVFRQRGGEALHCLHAHESPEGCGHAPFCKTCVIRNSVTEAIHGTRVVRRQHKLEIVSKAGVLEIHALITASPFVYQEKNLVLLMVEDISELMKLRNIIPICASCKKVRNDRDYWVQVESYFEDYWDMNFTHGLCPDCFKAQLDELYTSESND